MDAERQFFALSYDKDGIGETITVDSLLAGLVSKYISPDN
jgi:hypothetical protein